MNELKQPVNHQTTLPSWPYFSEEEITAAADVLRSGKVNYWTGQQGKTFEREFADYIGVKHAVALANGTVALELALHALGIGPGDEVIVPSTTFIASASCAVARGARPIVVDIDPNSQNLTAATILPAITPKTKAIIVVHLGGWPCDMDSIMALAKQHNLKVIEDCAQALGAKYKGKSIGSFGHAAAFSFCQDKIMTTAGEGGMLVTNDTDAWKKAWAYKDIGKDYHLTVEKQHPPGFRWLHTSFGTNWRMTEMQAAVGRIQLKKVDEWVKQRRALAAHLYAHFQNIAALRISIPEDDIYHAYYRTYVHINLEKLAAGWDRDRIMVAINAHGIPCFVGSCSEIYLEEAFAAANLRPAKRFPIAKACGETSLAFLVHPTCSLVDMDKVCQAVEQVFAEATLS